MLENAIAPSPAVPTCRPEKYPSHRKGLFVMPSVTVDETQGLSRITSFRRQHPRSAGDSNRPMRNENILELVRFFQTPKDSRNTESSFEMFKAGQRKLRKLGQSKPDKQSKATATTMTLHGKEDKDKQVVANLQQSGYLPSRDHSTDLERRPSRARRDVEAMGRPWLDDAEEGKDYQYQKQNRHISLGLGDLTALVEFSVSFPEYDSDGVPPPYQERQEEESLVTRQPLPSSGSSTEDRNGDESPTKAHDQANSTIDTSNASVTSSTASDSVTSRPSSVQSTQPAKVDSDADDAQSLAILLRATEKLERERRSGWTEIDKGGVSTLNRSVTDTPFSALSSVKEGKGSTVSRGTDHGRTYQYTAGATSLPKMPVRYSGGPIPLKLVAEHLPRPLSSAKSANPTPQTHRSYAEDSFLETPLNSAKRSESQAETHTSTLTSSSRQKGLLAPFAPQRNGSMSSRRVRSVTPDGRPAFLHPSQKGQKNQVTSVIPTTLAPKPAPSRPLPSIPGSNVQRAASNRRPVRSPLTREFDSSGPEDSDGNLQPSISESSSRRPDSPTLGPTERIEASRDDDTPSNSQSVSTFVALQVDSNAGATPSLTHVAGSSMAESTQPLLDKAEEVLALRFRDVQSARHNIQNKNGTTSVVQDTRGLQKSTSDAQLSRHNFVMDEGMAESMRDLGLTCATFPGPISAPLHNARASTPRSRPRRSSSTSALSPPLPFKRYEEIPRCNSVQNLRASDHAHESKGAGRSPSPTALPVVNTDPVCSSSDAEDLYRPMETQSHPKKNSVEVTSHGQRSPTDESFPNPVEGISGHVPEQESQSTPSYLAEDQLPTMAYEQFSSNPQLSPHTLEGPRTREHETTLYRYLQSLERRVGLLERQNKVLQEALLAALDVDLSDDVAHSRPESKDVTVGRTSSTGSSMERRLSSSQNIQSSHQTQPHTPYKGQSIEAQSKSRSIVQDHIRNSSGTNECFQNGRSPYPNFNCDDGGVLLDNMSPSPRSRNKSRDSGYEWELTSHRKGLYFPSRTNVT